EPRRGHECALLGVAPEQDALGDAADLRPGGRCRQDGDQAHEDQSLNGRRCTLIDRTTGRRRATWSHPAAGRSRPFRPSPEKSAWKTPAGGAEITARGPVASPTALPAAPAAPAASTPCE